MRILSAISIFLLFLGLNVGAQTILKQDGKYGLSDKNGTVVLKPVYDLVVGEEYLPTFFIVQKDGKYAYAYKVELDSLTWLSEDQTYWNIGNFEFDSLKWTSIGGPRYDLGYGYTILSYRKSGLWGMLYIQTHSGSGDGMFPSAGFYTDGMGKLFRTEARYDEILRREYDYFYTTYLNGKYGLLHPIKGEEYVPEFDTIPVYKDWRTRYVKKNGKWGAIWMDEKTKTIKYNVPCECNKVKRIWDGIYGCTGYGDTITFFDSLTSSEYRPTLNGYPFVYTNDSIEMHVEASLVDMQSPVSAAISVTYKNNSPPKSKNGYNELYYVNIRQKKITAYNEPGKYYSICTAQQNGLLIKTDLHPAGSKRLYEFYNMETGEFRFSFSIDSSYRYWIDNYTPKNCAKEDEYRFIEFTRFTYRGDKRIVKVIGYYDFREEKFTKRKPKYKPSQ